MTQYIRNKDYVTNEYVIGHLAIDYLMSIQFRHKMSGFVRPRFTFQTHLYNRPDILQTFRICAVKP